MEAVAVTPNLHAAMAPLAQTLHQRARTARHHKFGQQESVHAAQEAAKVPRTEQVSLAATATVAQLNEAGTQTKPFDREAFRTRLMETTKAQMSQARSKEEAEEVMNRGAAKASATLGQDLKQQRDAAAAGLPAATDPQHDVAPDQQKVPPAVELRPEAAGPAPAAVDSAAAVPPPLPDRELDFSADRAPTDQAMAESQVTTAQMEEGNDPAFGPVLSERANAEKHEAEAAGTYRTGEAKTRTDALTRAQVAVRAGLSGMHGVRERELGKVAAQQHGVRSADALKRTQIMIRISQIKSETQSAVKAILDEMDREASRIFTDALQEASQRYEDTFSDVKGGAKNWLLNWGDDWKELIEQALASARGIYNVLVYKAIDEVANYVERQINAAKDRAALGQRQANEVVDSLGGEMGEFAAQARESIATDFGAMQSQIDQRCDALVNRLSEQLKASYDKMKAREEELREANKSLWERVYDATVGAIKKIIEFKNLLFSVLAKAASVVLDIIAHPIRFLGNLVDAVGQGLRNFIKNIGTHLEKGLIDWLFGAIAGAGLKLPDKFDLEGIVSIVLQILGLTYDHFRARAVSLLGEPVVAALEKGAEVFMIFMREGVAGIWRFIKEKVTDLKSMVMDAIWDFIKETVITAGITWIISLLNPASAFFKACKAIYDIIVFVVNRASQLVSFVSAVVDSVAAIVAGNLGAATAAVEDALAKAIPVAIGLLASLLGLGDPSKPVKATIEKARSPIGKAIDWVILQASKLVKAAGKVVNRLLGKKDQPKEGDKSSRASVYQAISATLDERLVHDHTVDEARGIVSAVAGEFKPMGVSRIFIAPPDEAGDSPIVVEMSPGKEVGHLSRAPTERHSVTFTVDFTMAPAPADPEPKTLDIGIVRKAIKPAGDQRKYDYLGAVLSKEGTTRRAVLESESGVYKRYDTVTVGGMIFPEKGGRIRLRTWNTDSQALDKHGNQTHAEMQFVHWLRQMHQVTAGQAVLERVIGVKANLVSLSPCSICGELFPEMTKLLPNATSRQISWSRLYSGPSGPTSVQTIREIQGAAWTIVAPEEAMPVGTPKEHYVDKPRKR